MKAYDSFRSTILFIFSLPMGNLVLVDPSKLNNPLHIYDAPYHNIMYIFFAFIFSVLVVNLIIAILSNIYVDIIKNSNMQYTITIHEEY